MLSYNELNHTLSYIDTKGKKVSFADTYPSAVVGIKRYLHTFPNGEYTENCKLVSAEMRKCVAEIKEKTLTTKYSNLFLRQPYAHQVDAVERLLHCPRLALLLEQGLGKTYITCMALRILKEMYGSVKALVICPKIVLDTWEREIRLTGGLTSAIFYCGSKNRREAIDYLTKANADIVVTTYDVIAAKTTETAVNATYIDMLSKEEQAELAKKVNLKNKIPRAYMKTPILSKVIKSLDQMNFLQEYGFDTLVVDEASRVLNRKSQRAQCVLRLSKKIKRAWLLSGTLCTGKPTDMYMPMQILDSRIYASDWWTFMRTYCVYSNPYVKQQVTGFKNIEHLKAAAQPYIVSKIRADCLDMPERVFVTRHYHPSAKQVALYNKIIECTDNLVVGDRTLYVPEATVKIIKLMQVLSGFIRINPKDKLCGNCEHVAKCVVNDIYPGKKGCIHQGIESETIDIDLPGGSAKLPILLEDIEYCGGKSIVWAWYRHEISQICAALDAEHISYVTPNTPNCEDAFNNDPKVQVFVGQTMQGIGITLNSASTTIYYSHGCALEPRLQSMDRNYRIGQKSSVLVLDYVCKGAVDEEVVSLLNSKKDVMSYMQDLKSCIRCSQYNMCMQNGTTLYSLGCRFAGKKASPVKIDWNKKLEVEEYGGLYPA